MKKLVYVFIGGFCGALCRNTLFHVPFLNSFGNFPLNTLTVNLLGCFFLSLAVHLAEKRISLGDELHLALTTGFLGAFTTFSTFSKNLVDLIRAGDIWYALIYIIVSLVGGFLMVYIGYILTEKETV